MSLLQCNVDGKLKDLRKKTPHNIMYMYMHFKNKKRIIIYCSYMIFPESSTSKTNDLEPNITVHLWSYAAVFSYILVVNAKISARAEHYSVKTFMNQKWKELVLVKINLIIIIQWASGEPNHYFFSQNIYRCTG